MHYAGSGLATSVRQTLQALADLVTGNPDTDADADVGRKSTKHLRVRVCCVRFNALVPSRSSTSGCVDNTAEAAPPLHFFPTHDSPPNSDGGDQVGRLPTLIVHVKSSRDGDIAQPCRRLILLGFFLLL